jgi:hypothetical protein
MPSPLGGENAGMDEQVENAGMDEQVLQLAEQLLETGFLKLSERERRVITGVAKRPQISRDVNPYLCGKADPWRSPGRSRRLIWRVLDVHSSVSRRADRLDRFQQRRPGMAGRTIRSLPLYLHIFLNLILSMLAALQAPIILMSQNRQAARDRLAAGLDYEVNLKAEIEIIELHEKLDRILGEHLDELLRTQREQLQLLTQLTPANSNAQ